MLDRCLWVRLWISDKGELTVRSYTCKSVKKCMWHSLSPIASFFSPRVLFLEQRKLEQRMWPRIANSAHKITNVQQRTWSRRLLQIRSIMAPCLSNVKHWCCIFCIVYSQLGFWCGWCYNCALWMYNEPSNNGLELIFKQLRIFEFKNVF